MKKTTIGYIYNEEKLGKDEKLFLKIAKDKNVNLIMINTAKELDEEELEKKINECNIFFNNSAENFSMEIVKTIEELGKRIIEPSEKFYYNEDKWMFFLKCKKHKIPTLKTRLLSQNRNIIKKELKEFNEWPVVLKRIEGTMAEYVDKAENLSEAEKIINQFWRKGSEKLPIIAQEFVKSPTHRVTIIGDKIAQTALKESNKWKTIGNCAEHFRKFQIDNELKRIVDKINKNFAMKIYGIDLFKKDGRWLVLEINSAPAFDFFPEERKKLIIEIINFLKKEAKKK